MNKYEYREYEKGMGLFNFRRWDGRGFHPIAFWLLILTIVLMAVLVILLST